MIFHLSPAADAVVRAVDHAGASFASAIQADWLDPAMHALSASTDPVILVVVACVISAYLLMRKKRFLAMRLAGSVLAIAAFVKLIKHLLARARPLDSLVAETGFSFPSGHAAVGIVFFYILYMTVRPHIDSLALRRTSFAAALLLPLLIGASRIYLGVHFLSDVIGGFLFGGILISLLIMLSPALERRMDEQHGKR